MDVPHHVKTRNNGKCKTTPSVDLGYRLGQGYVISYLSFLKILSQIFLYKYKLVYYNPSIVITCSQIYNKNIS